MYKYLKVLYFLSVVSLFAQSPGYQSGSASANLIMPLSVESGAGDLDFGDILVSGSGSRETISPMNGKEFIVKGELKRNISVVFNDVELTNHLWLSKNNGVSGSLTFLPQVTLSNSANIKSGDTVILEPNGLIGETVLHVGGAIDIKPNQPVGDYEGIFVISVSY